jgi:NAD(P)-dependent dehydrogenase (short-subunit alcohol dehydrogenase family)
MNSRLTRTIAVLVLSVLDVAIARAETVLITGANSGIGLEFAKQYAAKGWTVIATHRRDETPDTLRELIQRYPNVRAERMDVTSRDEVHALAEKLKGTPIDILAYDSSSGSRVRPPSGLVVARLPDRPHRSDMRVDDAPNKAITVAAQIR